MLRIEISGKRGAGKTTYANRIATIAKSNGQTVRVEDDGVYTSEGFKEKNPVDILIIVKP